MNMSRIKDALDLASEIEPMMKGHDAGVQGAALAQLLAIWVCGHPEEAREGLIEMHLVGVRSMIPAILKERGDVERDQS